MSVLRQLNGGQTYISHRSADYLETRHSICARVSNAVVEEYKLYPKILTGSEMGTPEGH